MTQLPAKPSAAASAMPAMMEPATFDHMLRVGKILAESPLFPAHLRQGDRNTAIANGVLVMNMALRLNEDPLTVAQNIYFVGGKPGWITSYMIAKANQHGVFSERISWTVTGEGDDLSVTAHARMASTGERVSATADMEMAKAEGWTKNPKYKSMPAQMLRYRAATFLIRLYCPEVMVGMPSQVEVEDGGMRDVSPADFTENANAVVEKAAPPVDEVEDAPEPVKEPKPEPTPARKTAEPDPKPANSNADAAEIARLTKCADMAIGDMTDGAPVDETLEMYRPEVEQMKAIAPEIHRHLMEQVEAFRTAESERG